MTTSPDDFNTQITSEFRANGGKVGGMFEGAPLLLLHHRGARTGAARVSPLVYAPAGEHFVVFASKGGAPHHPHWFLNLQAHPDTEVEVGTETVRVHARELAGEERRGIWEQQKQAMPQFAEYEQSTAGKREIPVVILERT